MSEDDLSGVRAICVDETSFKRGQSYVTVVSDAKARRVIGVEESREADTAVRFSYKLEEKGGDCNKIKAFVSDMSSAYESAKEECFSQATQVIDKFHVKQLMLQAMDEVQWEEQGKKASLSRKSGKKLLMIPEARQTEQQRRRVEQLSKQYSKTGRASRMVQALDEMYRCGNENDAEKAFTRLISLLRRSKPEPYEKGRDDVEST